MIIKGGSRGAPGQLAWHLQRRDTNETVEILELQSPAPDLAEAFRDWQILVEGTRGAKGLYHANIDPAEGYRMTREQWQRAVDVLENELGLGGQPRAVVLHEKHGRQHIHVVWARTDIDRMVVRPDSQNYLAHERASQRLELEFGHAPVPGKHAKRDRKKQPEFPRAEANQAEWQEGERTGIDPATRKDQITALRQACDNGPTFKAALEEQGYVLAQGDRRDFVIVDQAGVIHSLGRQIRGIKAAELREFMKDVASETIPTAAAAVALQRQRQTESPKPETHQRATIQAEGGIINDQSEPRSRANDQETAALRKAVADRQAEEHRRLVEAQRDEREQLRDALELNSRNNLDHFDADQRTEAENRRRRDQTPVGIAGFIRFVRDFFVPARAAAREDERRRADEQYAARQQQERDAYAKVLELATVLEMQNLADRHALQVSDHAAKAERELDRYLRERETARRLEAENEESERQREAQRVPEGPERPPPTRAR